MLSWLLALAFAASGPPSAAEPPCTPDNSIDATVTEISRDPARFVGRCVEISGPANGIAMYSSVEGIYLTQPGRVGWWHRIGLYSKDNAIRSEASQLHRPRMLVVTGRVDICESMEARAAAEAGPDSIIMMTGYCHYYGGPVVRADSYREDRSARLERLVGERARSRYGDLVAMPDDWPNLLPLLRLADSFESALRSGDRRRMAALHDVDPEKAGEHDRQMLDYLLVSPGSPFAQPRRAASLQSALFVRRRDRYGDGYREATRYPAAILCFCRGRDCSHLWPISAIDAENAPDKPYACTEIEPRDWTKRKAAFNTPIDRAWLAEPGWSAYRPG